ncbi:hypothetical protein EJ02DRAFT_144140 [Clathrospora elynae]|uniref:Uncharacterized protein n=1 Tax=Clathrospora elynae TaxID=706981 RepID=A0A6A5T255_9PLEO|nr:hypothetical protein EJ02DRAFT_144140 [Clathrospora elynae]
MHKTHDHFEVWVGGVSDGASEGVLFILLRNIAFSTARSKIKKRGALPVQLTVHRYRVFGDVVCFLGPAVGDGAPA